MGGSRRGVVARAAALGAGLAATTAVVAVAAASGAGAAAPAGPCVAAAGTQLREAGPYLVTLKVGPVPRMYTAAEAKAAHPTSGVVMLEPMKGVAAGMMMQGANRRHVRVQVCDKATGKALRSPRPTVEIGVSMMRQTYPLTLGYDVGTPAADVRFCQVVVVPNETLGITVTVGTQSAAFSVAPA